MQKRILCIVDYYNPIISTNANCADKIAAYFKKNGYVVDFLSYKNNVNDKDIEILPDSSISFKLKPHTISFLEKHKNYSSWENVPVLQKKIVNLKAKLKSLFKYKTEFQILNSITNTDVKKLLKKANVNWEFCFAFSLPIKNIIIGEYLKKQKLVKKFYPFLLDPYVNINLDGFKKQNRKKRIKFVNKKFRAADLVFEIDQVIERNKKFPFNESYKQKIREFKIPTLEKLEVCNKSSQNKMPNLAYSGGFYEDIRNPKEMLKAFSQIDLDYRFNIVGAGCENIIKDFCSKKIKFLGKKSHDECLRLCEKANVLVSLGNNVSGFIPSKIFEYIAFGKPIIHFYSINEDPVIDILNKYPLSFLFDLNNTDGSQVKDLQKFIKLNFRKQVSFLEAIKRLKEYTSKNICDKIYREIKKTNV